MPGLATVGGLALLAELHEQPIKHGHADLLAALGGLADVSLGAAIALLAAVMIATLIAQAFEFEMIRLLEGYWGTSPLVTWIRNRRVDRFGTKLRRLEKLRRRQEKSAFKSACRHMLADKRDPVLDEVRSIWKATRRGTALGFEASMEAHYLFKTWHRAANPSMLRRLEALEGRLRWYPTEDRLLPTSLGNTMRSAEDQLRLSDGGDLETFVLRNYESIPARLLSQLSSFRTRLDMYCSLVLVAVALGAVSVPATWRAYAHHHAATIAAAAAALALAIACYRAAITSARGYVSALIASDQAVTRASVAVASQATDAPEDDDDRASAL